MTTSTATLPLSSATPGSYLITRSNGKSSPESKTTIMTLKSASFPSPLTAVNVTIISRRTISCQAVSTATVDKDEKNASVSGSAAAEEEAKIGARVRVKVPLKVYHVPRVPEMDLTGLEGVIKQYVGLWKGKRISANLPYKVEFQKEIEGRGPVKFFAHLKEDELEFLA
ncbi:ferredoxin-thioredoxin reductase, variable chain-like [Durio zibethinus]|uniref:Ferredoxin-thioredoxin reductase, variable chain-like n=1 Tax=Durio zibethinus TaxID=66656 RepID=A0A6P5XBH4_DURZI|nr:ferredoxin-thioredoxin reductase, variable chain-like [Durio zibethinus]XP_022725171.1 ferredoxin-thioredoxin reductase, variable chain-like [Durio zibethinus]